MRIACARADAAAESAAGGGFADDGERRRRLSRVGGAERIAVHGGIGEGRLGAQRRKIARQHAAVGGLERHPLLAERGGGGSEDARERLLDRDHAAHEVSSCARQSPDLPPRFSISRTPSTLMPRSIALAMS